MNVINEPLSNQNIFISAHFWDCGDSVYIFAHFFMIHFLAVNIIVDSTPSWVPTLISGRVFIILIIYQTFSVSVLEREHIKYIRLREWTFFAQWRFRFFSIYSMLLLRMKKMPYFMENDTESFMQENREECLQFFIRIFMNKRSKKQIEFPRESEKFPGSIIHLQLSGADVNHKITWRRRKIKL